MFSYRLLARSLLSISLTNALCSWRDFQYISMLCRYMTTPLSNRSAKIVFIMAWKVAGALVSPNGNPK